jgi:DNA-binding transcriptional MocR family regulator
MWRPTLTHGSGPLYLEIAEALAAAVASGTLSPGRRLPTHRELADRLGVTVGTVSRAYAEAARRGLVNGEVGRGTFVRGGPEEEAGAAWVGRAGVPAAPERVLVCTGSQHGLAVVLATLLRPGDLLLTESLTYAGLKSVAGLLHLRVAGLPVDAQGLRPEAFEDACRKGRARALYLIPTLHNPTTAVMPLERRREIAAIAERHGVAVVEDDVHGLLPEKRPAPVAALAPERTCFLTSTSKTLAPGLRVAYVLAPAPMVPRLTDSLRATTWAVAPLTAAVASSWINSGTADAILAARRNEARSRQALAREILDGADFDAQPEAYYLWLRLPELWRRDSFTAVLRARGVALTPADAFAVGRDPAPHAVRLCIGAVRHREALRRGLALVADVLHGAGEAGAAVV